MQVRVAEMAGDATSAVLFCIDEAGVYCLIRGFGRRRLGVQDLKVVATTLAGLDFDVT